jgi:hypothetical protein
MSFTRKGAGRSRKDVSFTDSTGVYICIPIDVCEVSSSSQIIARTLNFWEQMYGNQALFSIWKKGSPLTPKFTQGVPIEVVPFAYAKVLQNLHEILGSPDANLRMAKMKAGPVVSDNANFIIDAPFPKELMKDPYPVRVLCSWLRHQNSADKIDVSSSWQG